MLWFSPEQARAVPFSPVVPTRDAEVLVFVSGKGGVGKTSVALNLGIQLSRRGARTILVDADFGLANANVLLNIAPPGDLSDVLDPCQNLSALLATGPDGLKVLCGVGGRTRGGDPVRFDAGECMRALRRLRSEAEIVLVDCGAGVNEPLTAFALAADRLIVTTTPEPTALTDAYATLKILHARGLASQVGVVVNMARNENEARSAARRLACVAAQFLGMEVEDIGHVPLDRHVSAAVRARVPFAVQYPLCPASACIDEIASRLMGSGGPASEVPGLWSRIANLFL